jgi:hypothetical protein
MLLDTFYNKELKTLKLPFNFNEELINLPLDLKIIIFDEILFFRTIFVI